MADQDALQELFVSLMMHLEDAATMADFVQHPQTSLVEVSDALDAIQQSFRAAQEQLKSIEAVFQQG